MNDGSGVAPVRSLTSADYVKERFEKMRRLRPHVRKVVDGIRSLSPRQCVDESFLENEFIPFVGLNDEIPEQFPKGLQASLGTGLHVWQYPIQLAPCLAWISRNVRGVETYAEIGPRWGGMTILLCEWLRKQNPELQTVICIDPMGLSPLLEEYFGLAQLQPVFLKALSTSPDAAILFESHRADFVFIDGDHRIRTAMEDHMLVRGFAKYILHHDIHSQMCESTIVWRWLKQLERPLFETVEFTEQYRSVQGTFMGLGVLARRPSNWTS